MKFFYWFRIVVKVLIPLMFLVIANITRVINYEVANGIAGTMVVAVLFYYLLIWQKVGEKKE
jgi:hypothetical protein